MLIFLSLNQFKILKSLLSMIPIGNGYDLRVLEIILALIGGACKFELLKAVMSALWSRRILRLFQHGGTVYDTVQKSFYLEDEILETLVAAGADVHYRRQW